jgi:hypothetical protein
MMGYHVSKLEKDIQINSLEEDDAARVAPGVEANYLKGRRIDPALFCTLLNAQRRVFEAIGLRRRPRDVTPDLQTYLAQKADRDRE